jgi:spore coat protein CotH
MQKYVWSLIISLLALWFTACKKDTPETQPPPVVTEEQAFFDLKQLPEIKLTFSLEQWNKLLNYYDQNPKNEKKVKASFYFNRGGKMDTLTEIGVKLRGNTSRRRPEGAEGEAHSTEYPDWHHCHFGLDFDKYVDNQNYNGYRNLILKWFKDDGAYAREIYSYDLFQRFGIWTAPEASYCKLTIYVEGDTKPAYYGIYAMIESVDEAFVNQRKSHWGSDIGFMWKGGWAGSNNASFQTAQSNGVEQVELDPSQSQYFAYDLKTREEELATASAELTQFIYDLNHKTGDDFKQWISTRMDVDLFLKTYATNVILGMWDDYWVNANNFYFYFAPNGKAYFIPYDYDNSLGTSLLMENSGTKNLLYWGPGSGRPLINKILAISEYKEKYKDYLRQLINPANDLFHYDRSIQRLYTWHALILPHIANDTGEDMVMDDQPASWANCGFYRLLSGNADGGVNGEANFFKTRTANINF